MKRCGIVVVIAGLLLFSGNAWADEQTKNDGLSDGGHGTIQVQQTPAKQQEVKPLDMKMEDTKSITPEEHKNMNMGGNSDSHGTNEEVVETPPNIPVLSTFGGIMLAFILYGAWNKWLRKKERAHA